MEVDGIHPATKVTGIMHSFFVNIMPKSFSEINFKQDSQGLQ